MPPTRGSSPKGEAIHLLTRYDYQKMKEQNMLFNENLCKYVYDPKRLNGMCELYNINLIYFIDYTLIDRILNYLDQYQYKAQDPDPPIQF